MSRRSNLFGVGIVSSALPAWVPAQGTFAEFTLNRPTDMTNPAGLTDDAIPDFFANWCGGAFLRDYSIYGGVGYHGGGRHGGTPNNCGVVMLNLETRLYEWVCKTNYHNQPGQGDPAPTHPTDDFGHFQDDGTAASPHTYNAMCEWPSSWGGGAKGSLVRAGNTAGDSTTRVIALGGSQDGYCAVGRFDVSQVFGGHSRLSGAIEYQQGTPSVGNYVGACTDHTREGWFCGIMGSGGGYGDTMFVHKTGTMTRYTGLSNGNRYEGIYHHFGEQGQDVLLRCSDFTIDNFLHVADMSQGTPTWVNKSSAVSNASAIVPIGELGTGASNPSIGAAGIRWSTLLNCFVWLDWATTINTGLSVRIGKLIPSNPANILGSTWNVQIETVVSADGSRILNYDQGQALADESSFNGPYGRLLEAPLLRSLVWSRGSGHKGILIRLQGM
jgi:hypothetical protein